jgi:DNA damage-inducible protein 1
MMKRVMMSNKVVFEKKQQEQKIWSDPDNAENQRLIAERIREENVQANMEVAMEELPEGFGRVTYKLVNIIDGKKNFDERSYVV